MSYRVHGINRETGEAVSFLVTADDEDGAIAKASEMGFLIEKLDTEHATAEYTSRTGGQSDSGGCIMSAFRIAMGVLAMLCLIGGMTSWWPLLIVALICLLLAFAVQRVM